MSRVPSFGSSGPSWLIHSLDTASDGILIEAGERVVYTNTAYASLLGYRRPSDLVARPIGEFVTAEDAERLIRFGRARISGQRAPAAYDFAALRNDITSIRLQASVSLSVFGGTPYIMTIARPFVASEPIAGDPIPGPHDTLSPREREVMTMLLDGKRPKVIAFELGLTENTVATHRTRLLEKIGVCDNRELFKYALRHRLVDWS